MFCVHCGSKLPDEAKFCSNCGNKVITIPAAPPPVEQPPVQEPVKQEPVKEVPVWQPPVKPEPKKEAPVQQEPVNQDPIPQNPPDQGSFSPPVQETWTPPTKENWNPPAGSNAASAPKINIPKIDTSKISIPTRSDPKKLMIPLIAAGAVLFLILTAVFFYSLGSSNSDTPKEKKEVSSRREEKSEKSSVSDTLTQRYDENGFFFTHDEFRELYAKVLEDKGSPFEVGKSEYNLETGRQWDLMYKNKPTIYFNTTEDPSSGRITTVKAGTNGLTAGYEAVTDDEIDAIHYLVEACYGPLTNAQWNSILDADYTLDTSTIKIKDVKLDGLSIKITQLDTSYSIDIYAGDPQQGSSSIQMDSEKAAGYEEYEEDAEYTEYDGSIFDRYPNGKKRFSNTFLFSHEEYAELFNATLQEEGYDYSLGNPTDVGDNKQNYPFLYQGEKVGWMIIEENSSGKVIHISFHYDFDKSKQVTQTGIDACLTGVKVAHGNMSQADWNSFYQKNATAVRDNYTYFNYDLSGTTAAMLVYKDSIHLETEVA